MLVHVSKGVIDMDLGTLADWANAIATLTATGAAIFAGRIAYGAYLREQAADRQLHAAGIHAWLASTQPDGSGPPSIVLMNAGDALVYDLSVQVVVNRSESVAPSR